MKLELENLYQISADDIQAQYRDGNIKELIQGIVDIRNKFLENAFLSLKNDNLDITTAKQDGLDMCGNLLGFYRYIPTDTSDDDGIQYFNFNNKNFRRLQFLNPNQPNYSRLSDDIFRRFLVLIYQNMFVRNTIPNVREFINQFFDEFDKIAIIDNHNMSIKYVFLGNTTMPIWLKWILNNYDILPRPAGVDLEWFDATGFKKFGFAPDDTTDEWYFKNIGNFDNSNFIPIGEL